MDDSKSPSSDLQSGAIESTEKVRHGGAADEAINGSSPSTDTESTPRSSTRDTDVSTTSTDPSEYSVSWSPRVHSGWEASCVAMARCDFCQKSSRGVIQKCSTCKLSICKECFEHGCLDDDKNHQLDTTLVKWAPTIKQKPSKLMPAKRVKPRVTRGRVTKNQGTPTMRGRGRGRGALEAALANEMAVADHPTSRSSREALLYRRQHRDQGRGSLVQYHSPEPRTAVCSPVESLQWQRKTPGPSRQPRNQELDEEEGQWKVPQAQYLPANEHHHTLTDWGDVPAKGYEAQTHRFEKSRSLQPELASLSYQSKTGEPVLLPPARHLLQIEPPSSPLVAPSTLPPREHTFPSWTSRCHTEGRDAHQAVHDRRRPSICPGSSTPYPTTPSVDRERPVAFPAASPTQDEWPPNHQLHDLAECLTNNAIALRRRHPEGPSLDQCLRDEIRREWSTGILRQVIPDDGRAYRFLLGATYIASVTLELDTVKNAAREWLCEQEKVLCKKGSPPIKQMPTRAFLYTS